MIDGVLTSYGDRCELISKRYAQANSFERTENWFVMKLQEEVGELTKAYVNSRGLGRKTEKSAQELKQELADEMADVLGHLLLLAKHNGIDLDDALKTKWFKYLEAPER